MKMLQLMITERLRAEYRDFEPAYPTWLETILDDELNYTITVITVCVNSFAVGILIGWIVTLL